MKRSFLITFLFFSQTCGIHDRTQSLLEDLSPDTSSVSECSEEEVYEDHGEDEVHYEKARQLLPYEDAPGYMKHNSYILSGYRGILNTQLCVERLVV